MERDTESVNVTMEQAIKQLSDATNTNNARLLMLEAQQQQLVTLTENVHDMKADINKICELVTMTELQKNELNQLMEENMASAHNKDNSSAINESFDNSQFDQHNTTEHKHNIEWNAQQVLPAKQPLQTIQTIIIPPATSIPTFSGNILENSRQFLIRVKDYAETVNHWDDRILLNGISQFLLETALEWYCQLRTSNRRPQSWNEFTTIFLNQFNSPIRRARQEQQWNNCKQEEKETINEFVVRLRALWREQKPNETEDDLVRHLMCKMRGNLLTMIGISQCRSVDEVITEAQKIEEILYQRNKHEYTSANHDLSQNTVSIMPPPYQEEDQLEIHAMSAQQRSKYSKTYTRTNYSTQATRSNYQATKQRNQSSHSTANRQFTYPSSDIICYACGRKGHIRINCPFQYKSNQNHNTRFYPKNDNGAQDGRVLGAPI